MFSDRETSLNLNKIIGNFIVNHILCSRALLLVTTTKIISNTLVLTVLAPLMNEIRFRLMGNRISMQLKFRQTADALAHASVDCPCVKI